MEDSAAADHPTQRFSNRVAFYERFRPRYPAALLSFLQEAIGLTAQHIVADIGSGTGMLAELFVRHGNIVYAVEPNDEMRQAAERQLGDSPNFRSVHAQAEQTSLAGNSIDLITVGQAFHWFELEATRKEFERILHTGGWVAVVYNSWNVPESTVAGEYRRLIDRYGIDYQRVKRQNRMGNDLIDFFGGEEPRREQFENNQFYDFEALTGRALSASYAPLPGHPNYEPLMAALRHLFDQNAKDGRLLFPYRTTVYLGQLR